MSRDFLGSLRMTKDHEILLGMTGMTGMTNKLLDN